MSKYSSGGKIYETKETISGDKNITSPSWVPGDPEQVGSAKDEKGAIDQIKSDSGSDKVKEK
jgi:hypothetical protein